MVKTNSEPNEVEIIVRKISGLVRLIRPINCSMMGFAVFVGIVLTSPQFLTTGGLYVIYGFGTGFLLTGASMIINDYYDKEIDAINEPNRPIPSGIITAHEALLSFFVLSVLGLLLAYFVSVLCLLVAVFSWIVVITYVTFGKRMGLVGNLLVSTCVAIPFIYGSLTAANQIELNVFLFALMAFLSNTGREITKGIVDIEGDAAANIKTIAVRFGKKIAAITSALFYVSAVGLTPIPWILGLVSFWFIPLVLITDFGLVASSFLLLRNFSRENARRIKNWVLLLFLIGLLAYVIGVIK